MTEQRRNRRFSFDIFLFATLAISLALFVLVAIEPIGADNAVLHSMALDLTRYGRIPYLGTWDNNFPGIIFLHGIGILLFGESNLGFRIFDIVIQLAFIVFLYYFLLRWLRPHSAALASVLYAAYYVSGSTYLYGQQDGYGMMLVLIGASFLVGIDRSKKFWLRIGAAGFISGISVLMRPTFLLYLALLGFYLLWDENGKLKMKCVLHSVFLILSGLAPIALLLLFYAEIPNGLEAFYTSTIRFNLDLYTKLTGGSFGIEIYRSGLMIPLAVAGVALKGQYDDDIFSRVPHKKDLLLFLSFIVTGLLVAVLMGKFWRYQFAPFYIVLIPFSAVGIERVIRRTKDELKQHFAMLACVLFSTFIGYNPIAPVAFSLGLLKHIDPFEAADEARRRNPLSGAKPEHALVDFLNRPQNRSATISFAGFDPYLRLDLARPFVGRFFNYHAIAFRTDRTNVGIPHYTEYQREWQQVYLHNLETVEPRFIILGRHQPFWYIRDVYDDCLHFIPGFDHFFQSNYRYDTSFGGFQVYSFTK